MSLCRNQCVCVMEGLCDSFMKSHRRAVLSPFFYPFRNILNTERMIEYNPLLDSTHVSILLHSDSFIFLIN